MIDLPGRNYSTPQKRKGNDQRTQKPVGVRSWNAEKENGGVGRVPQENARTHQVGVSKRKGRPSGKNKSTWKEARKHWEFHQVQIRTGERKKTFDWSPWQRKEG